MRFYLEYINHLGRLQKKSAHRRLQAGFTITEVLLAGVMMLIAVLVSGIGVINLLRSNYRANADSEIRNNLNRTLEFVSDDLRRARIIAPTEAAIDTTQVPDWGKIKVDKEALAVLAFQIPDPNNPIIALPGQIVYYTTDPENSLTGPRVLWRYGPNLDANGNYITPADVATWISSPVTDRLAAPAPAPDGICPEDFNLIAVNPNPVVDGFYACVRAGGNQVILNANAEVNLTTGDTDKVDYSVSTRVSPRATCEIFCLVPPPGSTNPTLPIVTMPANVTAKVIQGNCASCTVATIGPPNGTGTVRQKGAMGSTVQADAGDGIRIDVNDLLSNFSWTPPYQVDVYTSDSSDSPRNLDNNQVLFVFTTTTTVPNSYQVLVTITPR
ncbi:type II secretion system protein J [Microcystis sp.]|uniref:PulJ/GspJ family protein n=1 Tax=Microcystis sp. TaxID=1127 RepID=UPI00391AB97F